MSRRLPRAIRPFAVAQYRRLVGALTLSLLGSGVWVVALVFAVRELGGGPTQLSAVAAGNALALLAAVLIGGVAADRIPQRRILLAVQVLKTLTIAALGVLGLSGNLALEHLALGAVLLGLADGFFYPAYSAILPAILPSEQLLAANGLEGVVRPTLVQALGPTLASGVIAVLAPWAAFLVIAVLQLGSICFLLRLAPVPLARALAARASDDRDADGVPDAPPRHPVAELLLDLWGGVRYMLRTPWFFGTLVFATGLVLLIMGPLEVLLPFAVTRQTGGGAAEFALVLASFGVGEAVAALTVASLRLPRRYLTVMMLAWSVGVLPLALLGIVDQIWIMALGAFLVGLGFGAGQVIWGTLLQRRVPPEMLGRVSSLDFFVSLALMPVSMALAGPVGEAIGFGWTFAAAGILPLVVAAIAWSAAGMARDEIAHPLDPPAVSPAVADSA